MGSEIRSGQPCIDVSQLPGIEAVEDEKPRTKRGGSIEAFPEVRLPRDYKSVTILGLLITESTLFTQKLRSRKPAISLFGSVTCLHLGRCFIAHYHNVDIRDREFLPHGVAVRQHREANVVALMVEATK
jgi:hypothetical protein